MSNLSYEPAEERRGVLATLALIGALVVLGVALMAVSSGGEVQESGEGDGSGNEAGGGTAAAPTPDDLSFLCDVALELPEAAEVTSADQEKARDAAEGFTRAAYGYTVADSERYEANLEGRVVNDCFWTSVAGEEVEAVEEMVRRGGEENAEGDWLFLEEFVGFYVETEERISRDSGVEYMLLKGDAVWLSRAARTGVEEPDDLTGVQQRITLARKAGSEEWTVVDGEGPVISLDPDYERVAQERAEEIAYGGSG